MIKCMKMLDDIGIKHGNVVEWVVNNRAKSRWGLCETLCNGYRIQINGELLDEENSEAGLEETILHELLHTCKGCMNHGKEWKALAAKVNQKYGYNIKTQMTACEKGVKVRYNSMAGIYLYAVKCPDCGRIWKFDEQSDVVENPGFWRCVNCHSKLVRIAG